MNGQKCKAIRKIVYGERSTNPDGRKYFLHRKGYIVCDEFRQAYQMMKKVSKGARIEG